MEGLATEEEAETAEGAGWDSETRTAMEGGIQESGAGGISQDAVAGRGDTRKTTSVAADEAGVGGALWGEARAKGEYLRPAGKSGWLVLRSGEI